MANKILLDLQAKATAIVTYAVTGFKITEGGSDYFSNPLPPVTIAPPVSGTTATADAIVENGAVTGFKITEGGSGYDPSSPPTVTIAPPINGTTATATAIVTGTVTAFTVIYGGAQYDKSPAVPPPVTIAPPNSNFDRTATADAIVENDAVQSLESIEAGTGYNSESPPLVTIAPPFAFSYSDVLESARKFASPDIRVPLTKEEVPDSFIDDPIFVLPAEQQVIIDKGITDTSTIFDDDYETLLVLTAIQLAIKMIPRLPQLLEDSELQQRSRYSESKWKDVVEAAKKHYADTLKPSKTPEPPDPGGGGSATATVLLTNSRL